MENIDLQAKNWKENHDREIEKMKDLKSRKEDEIKLIVLDGVMSSAEYEELFGTQPEPEPEQVQYTEETWRWLALSTLVLLAGLAAVFLYRKQFVH